MASLLLQEEVDASLPLASLLRFSVSTATSFTVSPKLPTASFSAPSTFVCSRSSNLASLVNSLVDQIFPSAPACSHQIPRNVSDTRHLRQICILCALLLLRAKHPNSLSGAAANHT